MVDLAEVLDLPERNEANQHSIVRAVKRWLQQNTQWLLVVDNLEDIGLLRDMVPFPHSRHTGTLLTPESVLLSPSTGTDQDLNLVDSGKEPMSLLSIGEFRCQQITDTEVRRSLDPLCEISVFVRLWKRRFNLSDNCFVRMGAKLISMYCQP